MGRVPPDAFNPCDLRYIHGAGRTTPGFIGRAFDVNLGQTGVLRGADTGSSGLYHPKGLILGVVGAECATVQLTVGEYERGAQAQRIFTLTAKGVWLTAAGWGTAKVEVLTVGSADLRLFWVWTTLEPQGEARATRLLFLESVVAGGPRKIPEGASAVTPASADPGWSWRSVPDSAGPALTLPVAQVAGVRSDTLGDQYSCTVGNTLAWELWAP